MSQDAGPAPEWLLGTWKLAAVTKTDVRSGAKTDFFGPAPTPKVYPTFPIRAAEACAPRR
jgi:hypothetical protein